MLGPYRVLDLTDHRGELAGMLLADLGAEVIRVEPPGGSSARRQGPLLEDAPEAERSLQFFAYNRNKRSIVVDPTTTAGLAELNALVGSADIVLESAPGGLLQHAGLDFEALRASQPRIVHCQLTPYGADGPHAAHAASDLTIAAMGGPVSLQGVPERPPVRVSIPQVWRHVGAEGAVAALVAHRRMLVTGEAQFVDVSAQAAMTWTMLNGMGAAAVQGYDFERNGSVLQLGSLTLPLVFECADGHVVLIPVGETVANLMPWLDEHGLVDDSWRDEDWSSLELRILSGQEVAHGIDDVLELLRRFTARHSKRELFERGLEMRVTLAPVNTIADLLELPHLQARDVWCDVTLPSGHSVKVPGGHAVTQAAGRLALRSIAPRLGEHGDEIRQELARGPRRPAEAPEPSGAELPYAGLKVADFSWIGVGPISAKYLADHGATVVRVESMTRPDKLRLVAPFPGDPGIDQSHFFADMNASKLGLTLNLKHPAAIEVAKSLLGWADVYLESFTPGVVDRIGIGYETARALNPGIIMLSTCLMGQTGPAREMAGYGYHAGAVAGFYELTGWPDLAPAGPWMAYTDTIAPRYVASTLMAAIDHHRRTGEGQHIDGAQLEMGLQFLAPELIDYQVSGRLATRDGNRAADAAPHGVYPCAGDDQWCAIAVQDDTQWQALVDALGRPGWATAPELSTVAGRLARESEIDERLASWTRSLEPAAAMETLQKRGVPAGRVQRSSDLLRDPQYRHRRFYREHEHPEIGVAPYAGHQFRIRDYDSGPRHAAPTLGQHSFEVMTELLGLPAEHVAELMADGAIE
jgi:crotonobetainyl-CoA:carnitine CoA-transferase CaiB-like acyl-CoA transferase